MNVFYIYSDHSLGRETKPDSFCINPSNYSRFVFHMKSHSFTHALGIISINSGKYMILELNTFNRWTSKIYTWNEIVDFIIKECTFLYRLKKTLTALHSSYSV